MDQKDFGRFLPRGGRKVEVEKVDDAFTVVRDRQVSPEGIAAMGAVVEVKPLAEGVTQVQVAAPAEGDVSTVRDELMEQLRTGRHMVVHHEYVAAGESTERYQITDQIIVKFKSDVDEKELAGILDACGVVVREQYQGLENSYLVQVTDAAGENPVKVANRLGEYEAVIYAEPSMINRLEQFNFPQDELFVQQWHLYSKEQAAPDIDRYADASVYEAWQITKGSRDVVVAVLDDGFELSHPDFIGPGKIVYPVDFANKDYKPLPGKSDYHGTPCAGVAIAEENGQGCLGAAPGCAFMPVRFSLNATDRELITIFQHISARANIVSCSWGPIPGDYPLHSAVYETFSKVSREGGKDGKGLLIVFAAGNYDALLNDIVDFFVRWRSQDASGLPVVREKKGRMENGFATHPEVVTVSACTSMNKKALYSNYGRDVTVAAPSNNFDPITYSALPGRGITTTDNEETGSDFTPGKRHTNEFGGTSSATPLVAGIAALVKSLNPQLTAGAIKQLLVETADKIEDFSVDPLYGLAKGTYHNEHSEWFGFGRVNAYRAVQAAVSNVSGTPLTMENTTVLPIPDYPHEGVSSQLMITQAGSVAAVEVEVDVTHPWIGDLVIWLVSPNGSRSLLFDRDGFRQQNLQRVFTVANTPSLQGHMGEEGQGWWSLKLEDRGWLDNGVLNSWRLTLVLASAVPSVSIGARATFVQDDLTKIRGIGKVYVERLRKAGVSQFRQLAELSEKELEAIIQPRGFQQLDYAVWKDQAARMA